MTNDGLRLFRALARSEAAIHPPREILPQGCTVAVSRDCGAGGEEIGQLLADKLHVRFLDRELLDAVIAEGRSDKAAMERLDEHVHPIMSDWLYSLVTSQNSDREHYLRHLVKVVLKISETGGVILGRGAYLVLAHRREVFRVRIIGSPEACAERIAQREHIGLHEARKRVERVNAERAAYIRTHFNKDPYDPTSWDLLINTDRMEFEPAAQVILTAMTAAGQRLPEGAMHEVKEKHVMAVA